MASIFSLTMVKPSSFVSRAKVCSRWSLRPAFSSAAAARSRRAFTSETWRKEKVLPKTSCASSSLSTSMALATASVSEDRVFWRFSHSLAFAPHFSLTSLANAMSSPMELRASLIACLVCARSSSAAVFSSFFVAICVLAASVSWRLAAMSISYSALLVFSSSCSSLRSPSKSAARPCSTPWTLPVLGSCRKLASSPLVAELRSLECLARIRCRSLVIASRCVSCKKEACELATTSVADFTLLMLFSRSLSSF
mmetsp:Transcript_45314/g.107683  ORF Transcript_45314/g.107683 Transcript_45314/m.107683 type:complete len:253 (-) Transcript_45314:368-1126(-)